MTEVHEPAHGLFAPLDRREAVKRLGLLMGGALSASTVTALLSGCAEPGPEGAGYAFRALDGEQPELLARLVDLILPATDTPGALAAGAHEFIDRMLADWMTETEAASFRAGLTDLDARAVSTRGEGFLALDEEGQVALVATLDAEAYAAPAEPPGGGAAESVARFTELDVPFFRKLKELTLVGYYTSEVGATEELRWLAVPGRYDADIPTTEVRRSWA